jgi:hypothetical protein
MTAMKIWYQSLFDAGRLPAEAVIYPYVPQGRPKATIPTIPACRCMRPSG